jgi:hypothetical protein
MSYSPNLDLKELREKVSELLQVMNLIVASLLRGEGFTFLNKMDSRPSKIFSLAAV